MSASLMSEAEVRAENERLARLNVELAARLEELRRINDELTRDLARRGEELLALRRRMADAEKERVG